MFSVIGCCWCCSCGCGTFWWFIPIALNTDGDIVDVGIVGADNDDGDVTLHGNDCCLSSVKNFKC